MREDPGTLSDDDARGLKVSDVIDAYRAHRLDAGVEPVSEAANNLLYYVVKELLIDQSASVALSIDFAGQGVWTMIVVDDGIRLLQLDADAPAVDVRFLGELRGDYSEAVRFVEGELIAELRFADRLLPAPLELELMLERRAGRDYRTDATIARDESIVRLRALLRRWGAARPIRA